ncbi:MAG: YihY/virulence factor BrkB family protein [Halobacteriovoraceae bacterium]|jgi:membrane protein|nr:YihY/virulence factor BrkB family protein [Halobacteriovoraceae bacterium]MBT5093941.1 YihY/virulence factor BrkB family protein [Halobacteriovoraceae bacterium]
MNDLIETQSFIVRWRIFLKQVAIRFYHAFQLFNKKKGTMLAAASSFYVLITIVPLILLIIRMVGFFIGDISESQEQLFSFALNIFPKATVDILMVVKKLVHGPLYGGAPFTVLNSIILTASSLSFFNSIWNGLYLMTEDRSHVSLIRYIKGVGIIGVTICILCLSLILPPFFLLIFNVLQNNFLISFLWDNLESIRPILEYFQNLKLDSNFLYQSNFFYLICFTVYFAFLYRYFFQWKIAFREALLGSVSFVVSLIAGKNLFWIYFFYVRKSLIKNYGDYYTFIVGLIWIYLVMSFFFFGACLCHELQKNPLVLPKTKNPGQN